MAGGKGLVVPLSMDPREWLRGISVVERSVKDFGSELRDVEDAGDRLEKALADNFRDIERRARDVDIAGNVAGGARGKMRVLGGEIADEFTESWGEAVRSGDLSGAFTETISNAAMIGMAAGPVVGAIGFGVAGIVTMITQEMQARKQQLQEAVGNLLSLNWESIVVDAGLAGQAAADAALAPFRTFAEKQARIMAALNVTEPEKAWQKIAEYSVATGLAQETIEQAIMGNQNALAAVQQALLDNKAAAEANAEPLEAQTVEGINTRIALEAAKAALEGIQAAGQASATSAEALAGSSAAFQTSMINSNTPVRDIMTNLGLIADSSSTTATNWAAIAGSTKAAADNLARAKQEALGIPTSVTVNVINKLSTQDLDGDGLPG